jgi:single-stranded-DNA-specific exonuclease
VVAPADPDRAASLARAVGLSPLAAQLLLNRGITTPGDAIPYLRPRLADLRPPVGEGVPGGPGGRAMAGFAEALARIERAVRDRQTIGVFGDYDVDGVTSAALLVRFLRDTGAQVVARVARRDAGYGLSPSEISEFAAAQCAVVVACDCGTSDHEALAEARRRGLDVIIVDHHQVPERLPDALALINPHRADCRFPYKGLASVGVAFYLAAALRTRLRAAGWSALPDPRALLDLVALGTVADMAPLTRENRILVAAGMAQMRAGLRPGIAALSSLCKLPDGPRRAADLGQRLGPRLNAPGRLGAATLALELLLAGDASRAAALADACEEQNRRRREIQERVAAEADAEAAAQARSGAEFLVVAGAGWHPGVVGIVAQRIAERHGRPTAVLAIEGDLARGSLRSSGGLHLADALHKASDLLVRFGGHAAAAGLTVETARIPALRSRLTAIARARLGAAAGRPVVRLDAIVGLDAVGEPLVAELARLEPFGVGNPEPLLGVRDVVLQRARVVGDNHLQVTLSDGLHARDGIGFSLADGAPERGATVRASFLPELDTWQGTTRIRLRLRGLHPATERAAARAPEPLPSTLFA